MVVLDTKRRLSIATTIIANFPVTNLVNQNLENSRHRLRCIGNALPLELKLFYMLVVCNILEIWWKGTSGWFLGELTPLSTLFSHIEVASAFPRVSFDITPHNILPQPLAAFPHETIFSYEIVINAVAVTILEEKFAEPRIQPATSCSQDTYSTDCTTGTWHICIKGLFDASVFDVYNFNLTSIVRFFLRCF